MILNKRYALIEDGAVLVVPDIHGNYQDFQAALNLYNTLSKEFSTLHLVFIGDLIHGPSTKRSLDPEIYGYEDESLRILRELYDLKKSMGDKLLLIIGNHEYSHLAGNTTSKFHSDEAAFLESQMHQKEVQKMKDFFNSWLLAVFTANGVCISHGSPGVKIESLNQLESIDFSNRSNDNQIIDSFTYSYGQQDQNSLEFLNSMSELLNVNFKWSLHGHDKCYEGYFTEGTSQICITCFGAPDKNKRYALIDLNKEFNLDQATRLLHQD